MNTAEHEALQKETRLIALLKEYGTVAIAYSGGVDSTYLGALAHKTLASQAHFYIADTPLIPRQELEEALNFARQQQWQIEVFHFDALEDQRFLRNDELRCYYCKQSLFRILAEIGKGKGISVLLHGENAEDRDDLTRVGMRAAEEAGILAPLAEVGFRKEEIRMRSRAHGLPTSEKAAFACLATRLPKDTPITRDLLNTIESAETLLRDLGCRQYRVRHHGDLCRIEVDPQDMALLIQPDHRLRILRHFRQLGYQHITLDLAGYESSGKKILG
ncbi:MAG: ATP-dependent sacrificial sulfur transferase LarE [Candidatus Hydrogenedentales bacterium]|jgi:uncharacterized protein